MRTTKPPRPPGGRLPHIQGYKRGLQECLQIAVQDLNDLEPKYETAHIGEAADSVCIVWHELNRGAEALNLSAGTFGGS